MLNLLSNHENVEDAIARMRTEFGTNMLDIIRSYAEKLNLAMTSDAMLGVTILAETMRDAWEAKRCIFLCGNGGSAGNAIHLANDFLYGAGVRSSIGGLKVEALSANSAVLTCLGNDLGYDQIFAEQVRVKASKGDVLVALSGSGNSPNIVKAIETANSLGMTTFAILGFGGGQCKSLVQHAIHFPVDDMQVSEDLQMIVGHMCMQWLMANPVGEKSK